MRCAKQPPPRTTRATVRFGSSWSPAVPSLVPRPPVPVAEATSRPADQQNTAVQEKPPACAGGFFVGQISRGRSPGGAIVPSNCGDVDQFHSAAYNPSASPRPKSHFSSTGGRAMRKRNGLLLLLL